MRAAALRAISVVEPIVPVSHDRTSKRTSEAAPLHQQTSSRLSQDYLSCTVLHFLLRAYRSSEIDEFLAHITVIDSALGLHTDHGKGATARLVARLSALLDDDAGNDYQRLF